MADQTVAPKERVNITYKPATGDRQAEVELPLKMLFVGDYTGRADDTPLENRRPVNIDKDNFQQVLGEHNISISVSVQNVLTDAADAPDLPVNLKIKKLADFGPDAVAEQIPEVKRLLELREALTALKAPLGNVPAFRKKLQSLLGDANAREKLMNEIGIGSGEKDKA